MKSKDMALLFMLLFLFSLMAMACGPHRDELPEELTQTGETTTVTDVEADTSSETSSAPEPETETTESTPEETTAAARKATTGIYSLSTVGTISSPEYLAQREWTDWYDQYLKEAPANGVEVPCDKPAEDIKEQLYHTFNDELREKLDEICEEYGLKLHSDKNSAGSYEKLCGKLGFEPLKGLRDGRFSAGYYPDGAFYLTNTYDLAEGELILFMEYNTVGILHDIGFSITDPGLFEEKTVELNDDVQILAAENKVGLKNPRSLVIIPLDRGTVTITSYVVTSYDIELPGGKWDSVREARCLNDDELRDLIESINVSKLGSQSEETRKNGLTLEAYVWPEKKW